MVFERNFILNPIKSFKNLTRPELCLWLSSVAVVIISGFFSDKGIFSTIASLVGVTALIFCAKGDVFGQVLIICFAVFYGIVSCSFRYYGEAITYLGMSAPSAALAVVTWLKNPYDKEKNQVKINGNLKIYEWVIIGCLTVCVTTAFYFLLKALNTANLLVSTFSVLTSFFAACLVFRRSRFYGIAYGMNDIVLIILWVMASFKDVRYIPMIACFIMFLLNDMYGFFNWSRMHKRQTNAA